MKKSQNYISSDEIPSEGHGQSTSEDASSISLEPPRLGVQGILAYGVGHFYNDLCASMWFSYLLVFLSKVLKFSSPAAGGVLFVGQLTDAICTPAVGLESDRRLFRWAEAYGQRKSWHLVGSIFVTISFPFLFMECFGCNDETPKLAYLLYYIPFVVIFQIGWASVQISHLSLIPELARSAHDRTILNSVRYAFTVTANLIVFGICALILGMDTVSKRKITKHDAHSFRLLGLIVVATGTLFSFIFHIGTKENYYTSHGRRIRQLQERDDDISFSSGARTWREWLRKPGFYQSFWSSYISS